MADILVITKDRAEFQVYAPLVRCLRDRCNEIAVIAEGVSLELWLHAGEGVLGGRPSPSKVDPVTKCRTDIEVEVVLGEFVPNLVLTGLGAPDRSTNLSEKFGLAANKMGIKLGYVIDVWGAESRSKAVPDFICTLDTFGRDKINTWPPYMGREPRIYVTGSPAMDALLDVKKAGADLEVCNLFQNCNVPTVLLAGQDECTTPVVEGLVSALSKVGGVIIPRFHPKYADRDDLAAPWFKTLAKADCEVLWVGSRVTTQELAAEVDYVVSVFSNVLIEAAALGSIPVSWVSDIGRQKMRESLGGLTRFPLVERGCAIEVSSPEEFIERIILDDASSELGNVLHKCDEHYHLDGKNTERVVEAIEAELR